MNRTEAIEVLKSKIDGSVDTSQSIEDKLLEKIAISKKIKSDQVNWNTNPYCTSTKDDFDKGYIAALSYVEGLIKELGGNDYDNTNNN